MYRKSDFLNYFYNFIKINYITNFKKFIVKFYFLIEFLTKNLSKFEFQNLSIVSRIFSMESGSQNAARCELLMDI